MAADPAEEMAFEKPPRRRGAEKTSAYGPLSPTHPVSRLRGLAALILLTLVWGYSWVLIKLAVARAGPFSLAAHRAFVAALALFLVLKLLGRPLRPSHPRFLFVLGLVQTTFFLSLQGSALITGGAGTTAVLAYTMPVWTLLLSALFLGERIRASQALAGLLALAGLTLIISPWSLASSPLSQGLALGAALLWSVGTLMVKRLSSQGPLDVLNLNAWQCLFGSLALMPVAALAPAPASPGMPATWAWCCPSASWSRPWAGPSGPMYSRLCRPGRPACPSWACRRWPS